MTPSNNVARQPELVGDATSSAALSFAPPSEEASELPPCNVEEALEFLRFLREEDDAEAQRETFEFLQRALDEDRFSTRKIFP